MDIKSLLSNEIIEIFNYAKTTYKDEMRDIVEQIDQLIESIEYDSQKLSEIRGINNQISSLKQMYGRIDCLQTLSNYLLPESDEESLDNENNDFDKDNKENNKEKTNYNDKKFSVDVNIPHTLYENFTYTRPAYIEIESHRIDATQWKELFVKLCEYLIKKNEGLFRSFLHDPTMKGKKYVYFSEDYKIFRDARKLSNSNIYVESNFSAQTIRNIIIKMLEKYKIPKHKCLIYLRKDYSSLHGENKNLETINDIYVNKPDTSSIKIDKYAKEYFFKFFQRPVSDEQLDNFLDKEWCHDNLGICYPLLKKVDVYKPLSKQRGYNNQYGVYYANEFIVNNEKYLLCSQWIESFRPKLDIWIQKQNHNPISSNTVNNSEENEFHEINFGKKYNSFHINDNVLVVILKFMRNMWLENKDIVMGTIAKNLFDFIQKETSYNKPNYVVSKIRDYLSDNNIIKLKDSFKKNHYIICNDSKLEQLIANPAIIETEEQKIKIYLIKKQHRKHCPICETLLSSINIKYNIYEDDNCETIIKQQQAYGKTCPNCHKTFMTDKTYSTLLNQISSFKDKTNLYFENQFIKNE